MYRGTFFLGLVILPFDNGSDRIIQMQNCEIIALPSRSSLAGDMARTLTHTERQQEISSGLLEACCNHFMSFSSHPRLTALPLYTIGELTC